MMHFYPSLTQAEQAELPPLTAAPRTLPSKFADSTHQVFLCDTEDGRMVLKVCNQRSIAQSGFWCGLNHLFHLDFPTSLRHIQYTHTLLTEQGALVVPKYVASNNHFVLTRFIDGEDVDTTQVTDEMVIQLATHIGQLHQHTYSTWGSLHVPVYKPNEWNERLHKTLIMLAAQSHVKIPKSLLEEVLAALPTLQETTFVPMMLDLRWDQFRTIHQQHALALLDLDAFVIGPRALDLVLLEYVLTPSQLALFKAKYVETNDWPDGAEKSCYQLLLFLMQVLGETDVTRWMKPHTIE